MVHSICDSYPKFGAVQPRQTGVITRRKKWGRLTSPPSKSRVKIILDTKIFFDYKIVLIVCLNCAWVHLHIIISSISIGTWVVPMCSPSNWLNILHHGSIIWMVSN